MKATDWILTYTGRQFWPLEPEAAHVCIEDIAHALSLKCRFGGHVREFYSVAQHSVLCSEYVAAFGGDAALQMAALLHDAGEAYLPDVCRPVKANLLVTLESDVVTDACPFRDLEDELLMEIAASFGVGFQRFNDLLVKEADRVMLMTERRDLMPPSEIPWSTPAPRLWNVITPWSPKQSERSFRLRFDRLKAALAQSRDPLGHIEHKTIGSDPEGGAA